MRLVVPGYRRVAIMSCLTRDMCVKWIYFSRLSSELDSSGFLVGFVKSRKLPSPRKCSYKVNLNLKVLIQNLKLL